MSKADQAEEQSLFHCPNLQGVILGVGLAMVEQTFLEEKQEKPEEKSAKPTTGRRRKAAGTPSPHGSTSLDDEDYLPGIPIVGKKAKLGTGYAGDVREDVSTARRPCMNHLLKGYRPRILANSRPWLPRK